MTNGRIINSIAGTYTVLIDNNTIVCKPRGRLRLKGSSPVTGDLVDITIESDGSGVIEQILPRTNLLIRPTIANMDQIIVVVAPNPKPNFLLIDKILTAAENHELKCIVVVNKIDLADDAKEYLRYYKNTKYPTFAVSVHNSEGLNELEEVCKGHISVLAGQSGVGKSSIINYFCPNLNLTTQEINSKRGFGRHTTRTVSLLTLPGGGLLADTPGFNRFDMSDIASNRLAAHFPEMIDFLGQCKYKGCLHEKEPGCAVKQALQDEIIHPQRYNNYLTILAELKENEKGKYSWL